MISKPVLTWNFKFTASLRIYHNLFRKIWHNLHQKNNKENTKHKVDMRPIAMTFLAKLQTSTDLINYGLSTIIRLFEQRGLDFSYLFSADRLLNFTQTYNKHYSKISKTEITFLFWINEFHRKLSIARANFSLTPPPWFLLSRSADHVTIMFMLQLFDRGIFPWSTALFYREKHSFLTKLL